MQFFRRAPWRPLALGLVATVAALGGLIYTTSHGLMAPLAQQAEATSTPPPATTPGFGKVKPIRPGQTIGQVTAISQSPASFTVHSVQDGTDATYRVVDATVFYAPPDRPYNFSLLKVGDLVRVRGGGGRCQPAAGQPALSPGVTPTPAPTPGQPCGGKRQQLGQTGSGQAAGAQPGQPGLGRRRMPGQAGLRGAGAPGRGGLVDGLPVARRVIVRPAGEAPRGRGQGKGGVTAPGQPGAPAQPDLKKGASNGTGQ